MQAHKIKVTVPEDHQLEIRLPQDFPSGPAEVIVLAGSAPGEGIRERGAAELLAALEDLLSIEWTEEEKQVLEDFDRFRQAHPLDLASLVDDER